MTGLCFSAQAQSLSLTATNNSTAGWKIKLFNSGSANTINFVVPPGTSNSGSVANAAFSLKLIGSSNSGCSIKSVIPAPFGVPAPTVTIADSCGNNHQYKVIKTSNGNYIMKMNLN